MEYFEDFKLGSYKLSDFGGVICNDDGWRVELTPSMEYITEKAALKDGEFFFGSRLNPRVIQRKVYFEDEVDVDKLTAWLTKGEPQPFSFVGDTKVIDVVYDGFLEMECYDSDGFKGLMDLSFIAHDPYYRINNEKPVIINPIKDEFYTFKSRGNVDSYPLIKITPASPQSEIRFQWNGVVNTIKDVNKAIYLDCENEDLYEITDGVKLMTSDKYVNNDYWEFPFVKPFIKNTFQLIKGNVSEVEIKINSRIK